MRHCFVSQQKTLKHFDFLSNVRNVETIFRIFVTGVLRLVETRNKETFNFNKIITLTSNHYLQMCSCNKKINVFRITTSYKSRISLSKVDKHVLANTY